MTKSMQTERGCCFWTFRSASPPSIWWKELVKALVLWSLVASAAYPWSVMRKEIHIPVRKLCMTAMHCCVGWLPWRHAYWLHNEKRTCWCQGHIFMHVFGKLEGLSVSAGCSHWLFKAVARGAAGAARAAPLFQLLFFFFSICRFSQAKKKNKNWRDDTLITQRLSLNKGSMIAFIVIVLCCSAAAMRWLG